MHNNANRSRSESPTLNTKMTLFDRKKKPVNMIYINTFDNIRSLNVIQKETERKILYVIS